MIHEVDESLKTLIKRDALNGANVEISFEAPTKDWAARQNAPTLNVYLYDIQEDVERRRWFQEEVRDGNGRVTERRPPPRRFKLAYFITAWTQRPEDEHRILAGVLGCFLKYDALPEDVLAEPLADSELPVLTEIAQPAPEARKPSDIWSALGGELKPSLDLVVIAPFDTGRSFEVGPPVLEEPRITVTRPEGEAEEVQGRAARAGLGELEAEVAEETVEAGREKREGRIIRVRGSSRPPEPAADTAGESPSTTEE